MITKLIRASLFFCIFFFQPIENQNTSSNTVTQDLNQVKSVVFPQLNGILEFNSSTPAIQIQTDAGNFQKTKQFTIWGWYRQNDFYTFNSPSNIITLQNVQNFSAQEMEIQPYPNPNFPNCPTALSELDANPDLKEVPEIKNNPNCFPLEVTNPNIQNAIQGSFSLTFDEILFVNYLLKEYQEDDITKSTYELHFYLKNRDFLGDGSQSMQHYIIEDLPFVRNLWTFWAVAANYETGELVLYMRVFGPNGYDRLSNQAINYPGFEMNQGALLLIGATNSNNYFKTLTGYIGEVAYIQMSPFYLKNVQHLWFSEMLVEDNLYDGVNAELLFDTYEMNSLINSYGFNTKNVTVEGNYTPIYTENQQLLGAKFQSGSYYSFQDFPYRGSPFVSSHPFLFNFSYEEPLPDEFVLLEKGKPGITGYLQFKLVKTPNNKRKLVISARSSNKDFVWESDPIYEEKTSYSVLAGIVVSANRTVHAIMKQGNNELVLSEGMVDFENYDFSYSNIVGLRNSGSYDGSITMNRMNIMDNFSGSVLMEMQKDNQRLELLTDNCLTRTDYFNGSFGCLICKEGFLNIPTTRKCAKSCPKGFRNNGDFVCVKCLHSNCSDIPPITWKMEVINSETNTYRLIPSRPFTPSNISLNELVNINFSNLKIDKDYTYTLKNGPNNEHVDVVFDFKKNIYNEKVNFEFKPKEGQILYDQYKNPITGSGSSFNIQKQCNLSIKNKKTIRNLAIAIFFITLGGILLALMILCCCIGKLQGRDSLERRQYTPKNELSNSIWKFILHNWMKLQMVAFLIFINTPFACCLRIFLETLYRYAVGWAHGMGPAWDGAHRNDLVYNSGFNQTGFPNYVNARSDESGQYVKAFLLHNMGIIFIFHLVVLVVYIIFRIIDYMLGTDENFFYKLFILVHMNFLILGYLLFHMMAFVFSFLNFAFASFTTTYFTISFIVAVFYIAGNIFF